MSDPAIPIKAYDAPTAPSKSENGWTLFVGRKRQWVDKEDVPVVVEK
jgi:hypothetical protein